MTTQQGAASLVSAGALTANFALANGVVVSTVPVLIASVPAMAGFKVSAGFTINNGPSLVYLSGLPIAGAYSNPVYGNSYTAGIIFADAVTLAASASLSGQLFPGDQLWAATASGSTTLSVLETGGGH